ncbi:hypothetical protein PMAYCL1PPCAC_11329, partial [Pristionchus mayeri]
TRMRLPVLLLLLPVLGSTCLSGYSLVYDGQCFKGNTSSNQLLYADAKNTCASDDSHLPQFYSKQEVDNFMTKYYGSNGYGYWIGLLC